MVSFGITKDEYFAEIYKSLSIIYEFKTNQINFNEENSIFNLFSRPFRKIYYYCLNVFYAYKCASLFIKTGEKSIKSNSNLEGLNELMDGYERVNPSKTYKILCLADNLEKKTNPLKQKIYDIKKAVFLEKSDIFFTKKMKSKILEQNIGLLDPKWEKEFLAETLLELIKSTDNFEKQEYLEKLFALHPVFLPLNNLEINADIVSGDNDFSNDSASKVINEISKRGIIYKKGSNIKINIHKSSYGKSDEYSFNITYQDNLIKNFRIKIDKNEKKYYEKLGLDFFNKIFIVDLS
jgi:hypothetical protein